METSEYSDRIKFFDWPEEWQLDKHTEEQVEVDLVDEQHINKSLKDKLNDTKKDTSAPEK